jgi:putative membrane-bound dehydrogenase-like protein
MENPRFLHHLPITAGRFLVLSLLVAGLTVAQDTKKDDLPEGVVNTQNPKDISLTPRESLERIQVPAGFQVTLFAGEPDLRRPIAFDFDDRGRLWVVENYSHPVLDEKVTRDRVLILEDSNQDGRFDRRTIFWDQGRYLTAIAVGHGGVWLGNTPDLTFIPDADQDGTPDGDAITILDGFQNEGSNNNNLNNFHWGPDGWLYGAIGINPRSLVGKPGTPDEQRTVITRGLWRMHPVSHAFEVVATGMVNPWGADFNDVGDHFTVNTVTAHLWHIVPGAHCERRAGEYDNPYAYARIQAINDHLHWGGGAWHSSRQTTDSHSVAGGGHAHCGAMIYYGDNWPDQYRGTLLTNNLHGNRVNNDLLVPRQSSYIGNHGKDVLFANDPWFRGLSIKYGPDGGVFISDWHDFGECHDSDGSHRTTGRIYKVTYGIPERRSVNLRAETSVQLAELHQHRNEWIVRHARRILHERAVRGDDMPQARKRLWRQLQAGSDHLAQLRALWTLSLVGDLQEPDIMEILEHPNEHLRRWAVRLLVDRQAPGMAAIAAMARRARIEESPKVRLALGVALRRIDLDQRWELAEALVSHGEDARDTFIPLIVWYAIEPLVQKDLPRSLQLAVQSQIPLIRQFIARRAVDTKTPPLQTVVSAVLEVDSMDLQFDLLRGILETLDGQSDITPPPAWAPLYKSLSSTADSSDRSVAIRLATIFGDKQAIGELRDSLAQTNLPRKRRSDAFQALLKLKEGLPVELLHQLASQDMELRSEALQALVLQNNDATATRLLEDYPGLGEADRQHVISVLATRQDFSRQLVKGIQAGQIDRDDVSAFALQQLRSFSDEALAKEIAVVWPADSKASKKSDEIARYLSRMNRKYLASGDARAGRTVFNKTCAKCHTLFGEGGTIGPDLTGSGRQKIDYVVTNLVDPSANVDAAYRLTTVITNQGRLYSGFVVQHDDSTVVLRTPETRVRLEMKNVDELVTSEKSMMPEGMLRTFSDEQVRDLLLYLSSPMQVEE